MNIKRLKITLKVLNDVKQEYPTTKIEDRLEEECSKENISVDEVIFFYILESKELASTEKIFFIL